VDFDIAGCGILNGDKKAEQQQQGGQTQSIRTRKMRRAKEG